MIHAKSLRVIGQVLESAAVPNFELEKHGPYYVTWSPYLRNARDWRLEYSLTEHVLETDDSRSKADFSLCFSLLDVSRLDAQARKNRRNRVSSITQGSSKLSQLLRVVGDQLDRVEAAAFDISWGETAVAIDTLPVGDPLVERKNLTFTELQQLCLQRRLRRSSPQLVSR
jgi:hypothetical protein